MSGPRLFRPKGQSTAGLAAGVHFDTATIKHTVLNESTVASEKHIPETFMMSTMSDSDLPSFHTFVNSHGGPNSTIVLESYLPSSHIFTNTNPRMTQAIGTMSTFSYSRATAHMTHGTFGKSFNTKNRPSDQSLSICRNWNDVDKGCVWKKCTRKHVFLKCAGDHPAFKCTRVSKPG
jgi:hypothetical protein